MFAPGDAGLEPRSRSVAVSPYRHRTWKKSASDPVLSVTAGALNYQRCCLPAGSRGVNSLPLARLAGHAGRAARHLGRVRGHACAPPVTPNARAISLNGSSVRRDASAVLRTKGVQQTRKARYGGMLIASARRNRGFGRMSFASARRNGCNGRMGFAFGRMKRCFARMKRSSKRRKPASSPGTLASMCRRLPQSKGDLLPSRAGSLRQSAKTATINTVRRTRGSHQGVCAGRSRVEKRLLTPFLPHDNNNQRCPLFRPPFSVLLPPRSRG